MCTNVTSNFPTISKNPLHDDDDDDGVEMNLLSSTATFVLFEIKLLQLNRLPANWKEFVGAKQKKKYHIEALYYLYKLYNCRHYMNGRKFYSNTKSKVRRLNQRKFTIKCGI